MPVIFQFDEVSSYPQWLNLSYIHYFNPKPFVKAVSKHYFSLSQPFSVLISSNLKDFFFLFNPQKVRIFCGLSTI